MGAADKVLAKLEASKEDPKHIRDRVNDYMVDMKKSLDVLNEVWVNMKGDKPLIDALDSRQKAKYQQMIKTFKEGFDKIEDVLNNLYAEVVIALPRSSLLDVRGK